MSTAILPIPSRVFIDMLQGGLYTESKPYELQRNYDKHTKQIIIIQIYLKLGRTTPTKRKLKKKAPKSIRGTNYS